ncbi:MAG: aminotransferase class IV [Candidatus Omnitrophica bacterium]|nr:aminotransferase class IV [Candidatus Omnitrophota bacterium]
MYKIWMNGKLLDEDKAKIPVYDRGFMYGDGLFETMRSYSGNIFRLDDHINRLLRSMKLFKMRSLYGSGYYKKIVNDTLKANALSDAYVKLIVTRGEGRFGIAHKDSFKPNTVIVAKHFEGYPDWAFRNGLSAKVTGIQNDRSMIAGVKSLNYLPYILARLEAQGRGFDEAILTNTGGCVTEAATSNIFLVKGKSLITPSIDSGILPGITRKVIIDIAQGLPMKVEERAVSVRELFKADELFLTNSLAEVLPVTRVDSKRVGRGLPGKVTGTLHASYRRRVNKNR